VLKNVLDSADIVRDGMLCWAVLYWVWKREGRDANKVPRTQWRRAVRTVITLVAGAVVLTAFMPLVAMILNLGHSGRQARPERDKVRVGMTIGEVLLLVHGDVGIKSTAGKPENCALTALCLLDYHCFSWS